MDKTKQKIIIYLLALSFVLLLGNIAVERFHHKIMPGEPHPGKSILTADEVNTLFEDAIMEFGIEKSWIEKKVPAKGQSNDAAFNYKVKISADLPVTLILNELNRRFYEHGISLSSKEMRKEKTTSLKILQDKNVILRADFVTDPSILRSAASVGFIIKDAEKLSEKEFSEFLQLPEYYALVLSPSEKTEKEAKEIISQNREYAVVISDKIDEVRFRFDDDYSQKRLAASVRAILGAFGSSKLFFVDDRSDFYRSRNYVTVKSEFEKRKLSFIPLSNFTEIKSREDRDVKSVFRYSLESSTLPEKIFLVSAKDFLELKDMIDLYRKKGYKFVYPSQLNFGLAPIAKPQEQVKPEQTKKQNQSKKQKK